MPSSSLFRTLPLVLLLATLGACGDDDADTDHTTPLDERCVEAELPPSDGTILEWLEEPGNLQSWARETAPHPSAGPHFGNVVTYINTCLEGSMSAGNDIHPVGAASVKALFGPDGVAQRQGWAVSVKVDNGGGGDDWYWYQRFDGEVTADSRGENFCVNCHNDGTDHVLTGYPLQ